MKFYKYKQLARINCIGFDDELLKTQNSYYHTPFKNAPNQTYKNTKLMRFRFNGLNNIEIGKNTKLVLESIFVPIVLDNYSDPKVKGAFTVRCKNLSAANNFDSSNDNVSSSVLFSHTVVNNIQVFYDKVGNDEVEENEAEHAQENLINTTVLENHVLSSNGFSFFNHYPKILYNFDIPNQNFLNQNVLEFELIYYAMGEFDHTIDYIDFQNFQCSLVIYDIDEEDLLLKDTDDVNFKLMRPQNPIFKI